MSEATAENRRQAIRDALYGCVLERGYAATTLADVARASDMSPSHLLYYYHGKDAILADYFKTACDNVLAQLAVWSAAPPRERIESLAAYFIGREGLDKARLGVFLEIFGLAVHCKELHRQKTAFDRQFKDWLRDLFAATPRAFGLSAEDCAENAFALLFGSLPAAFFDERLALPRAQLLLRDTMLRLADLAE